MVRIDTLRSSLLLALPLSLLVACGGGAEAGNSVTADHQSETPSTESAAPEQAAAPGSENLDDEGSGPVGQPKLEEGEVLAEVVDDGAAGENGPEAVIQYSPDGNVPLDEYVPRDGADSGKESDDKGWDETIAAEVKNTPEADEQSGTQGGTVDGIGTASAALTTLRADRLRSEARRNTLELNKSTSYYTHTTYINESTDTRRTDCSGFVGYVLKRTYPSAYDTIPTPESNRVMSRDFYNFLINRSTAANTTTTAKWRKINYVRNLRPGDVVVWKNPSTMENTGHTMMVRDYPRAGRASRNEILVPIYDSTSNPHDHGGVWDSRTSGSRTGVGSGTIGLKVDSDGRAIAYYWSGGTAGTATYRPFALGRLE